MKQNGCWYELYCIGARNRSGRASFDFCGDHAVDRTYLRAWPSDYFPVILERASLRLYERSMPLLLSASLRRSNVVYSTSPKLFATVHTTDEEVTNQVLSRGTRLAPLLRSYVRIRDDFTTTIKQSLSKPNLDPDLFRRNRQCLSLLARVI